MLLKYKNLKLNKNGIENQQQTDRDILRGKRIEDYNFSTFLKNRIHNRNIWKKCISK